MNPVQTQLQAMQRQIRRLQLLAAILLLLIAAVGILAFARRHDDILPTLRAEKIEVVEKDGTVKLSLFSKKHLPPAVFNGVPLPRTGGGESGLMFYNEEGEECGGLIYGGARRDGQPYTSQSLTFDKYQQDQVVQLIHDQSSGGDMKGLIVSDRPDVSIEHTFHTLDSIKKNIPGKPAQDAVISTLAAEGLLGHRRLFVGQNKKTTGLFIHDEQGVKRIEIAIDDHDQPQIIVYGKDGKIARKL
ncbi:hypothetical protein ACWKWU_05680 [Chitinophaga lutea]